MNPQRPLPARWQPDPVMAESLRLTYGHAVDVDLAAEKFKAYHLAEGLTSRDWDLRFKAWVIADVQKYRPVGASDELGNPLGQRPSTTTPLQPGDPGYVSIEDLAKEARGETWHRE